MEYRVLVRTGLKVSEIGFGGEWLEGQSKEESKKILDEAHKQGINFIDVFMPQPHIRDCIGYALEGRREDFILQGHLCTVYENEQYERTRDINKTKESFNDLLTRLRTDYIDIGMIHYVDTIEDYESVFNTEIIEYAKDLKEKGIIKYIGLSSHNAEISLKAVESGLIDVIMFSINPAYDMESASDDIMDIIEYKGLDSTNLVVDETRQKFYTACENEGVAITVMKALGAGTLLDEKTSPFGVSMTVPQCINYSLDRNGVKVVIVGFNSVEEIQEAMKYYEVSDKEKDYSHIFSTSNNIKITGRCMYCNHCQPCPMQIDIAAVTKFLDLAKQQDSVPETVLSHYNLLKTNASDCIMCGQCEPNCPFGVNIRENMEEAKRLFE